MKFAGLVAGALVLFSVGALLGEWPEREVTFVFSMLRLPRAVLGAFVGFALGLVGASYQILFNNPLASPSTVGTTAGASLGALAVILLGSGGFTLGLPAVAVGAFLGAAGVTALISGLASWRALSTADLLLLGIAISLGSSAVSLGLQVRADGQQTLQAVRWSLGSLATIGWGTPLMLCVPTLVAGGLVVALWRPLQAMAVSGEQAESQGVQEQRVRMLVLGLGSLLVGCAVAASGPIAFVGLLVPHLVRGVVGFAPRRLLPGAAIAGAGLLPFADGLARVAIPGADLPVGVMTAALGAPALVVLLIRSRS